MPSKQQQADSEIHEDQLLNFLINRLNEEVPLTLANNAEIDVEDIYEILVGATADGDLDLYAVQLQRRFAIGEHDPLPPPDKVRARPARTSR